MIFRHHQISSGVAVVLCCLGSIIASENGMAHVHERESNIRVHFHEHFHCIKSSDAFEHWFTSEDDRETMIAKEMCAFLQESLSSNGYVRSEHIQVQFEPSTDIIDRSSNVFQEQRHSNLRHSTNAPRGMEESCKLGIILSGDVLLDALARPTMTSDVLCPFVPWRCEIYAKVAQSILENFEITNKESLLPSIDFGPDYFTPEANNTDEFKGIHVEQLVRELRTNKMATSVPLSSEGSMFRAPRLVVVCLEPVVGKIRFNPGEYLCSPNNQFRFGLGTDGDLALLEGSRKLWSANTCCRGDPVRARLQQNGNLVVTSRGTTLWASSTAGNAMDTASLIVGDDGVATITAAIRGHIWSTSVTNAGRVDATSLDGKVMAGYQGWFFAAGDGGLNLWQHWSPPRTIPNKNTVTVDMWPDLRELDNDELYETKFKYQDGSNAGLYSAYNAKTVERHCRWMKEYDIDGVFVQRFISSVKSSRPLVDQVLSNVRSGSEKYGRTFVVMYDIGKANQPTIVTDIINDWKHLVDDQYITQSKQYLHHRGKPLLAIWGLGFRDRFATPSQAAAILDWFKNGAEDKYKATLMGGVPAGWRDLSRDSKTSSAWAPVYRSYDVISPWAVGRMADIRTANVFRRKYIEPDMIECTTLGIDYLPVVFPGFSLHNKNAYKPFNEIPRNGGTFLWHQLYNAISAGNTMVYVAMFDEVDEGTAIFKIAANQEQIPVNSKFLTLDADAGYPNVPSDWYLHLTGSAARFVHESQEIPMKMPSLP